MKHILPIFMLCSTAFQSDAASITVFNISGSGEDLVVTDSGGTGVTSGFVALYMFDTPPTNARDLIANGNNGLLGLLGIEPSRNPDPGAISASFDFMNVAGANLFAVIGNGTEVADSTEVALIDVTGHDPLTGNDTPTPQSLGGYLMDEPAEVIIGQVGSGVYDWSNTTGNGAYASSNLALVPIPEPSSTLLVLLGGLALVRRKR